MNTIWCVKRHVLFDVGNKAFKDTRRQVEDFFVISLTCHTIVRSNLTLYFCLSNVDSFIRHIYLIKKFGPHL